MDDTDSGSEPGAGRCVLLSRALGPQASLAGFREALGEATRERRASTAPVFWPYFILVLLFAVFAIGVGLAIAPENRLDRHFDEEGLVTYSSALLMAATSCFAFLCFLARRDQGGKDVWPWGRWLWLLIGLGFLFFALDEIMEFHEELDMFVADTSIGRPESFRNWNDVIVIGYGLVAAVVLLPFLPEVLRYPRFPALLAVGFGFYALHTLIDSTVSDPTDTSKIFEESAKLFAGAFFSLAVFAALLAIRQRRRNPGA